MNWASLFYLQQEKILITFTFLFKLYMQDVKTGYKIWSLDKTLHIFLMSVFYLQKKNCVLTAYTRDKIKVV